MSAAPPPQHAPLPHHARGRRPAFHEQASIDRLLAMLLALTSEVSVLADRVRTLEQLGEAAGWLAPDAADLHRPDPAERQRRDAAREALLRRVLAIVHQELAELAADAPDNEADDYWRTIDAIERGEV